MCFLLMACCSVAMPLRSMKLRQSCLYSACDFVAAVEKPSSFQFELLVGT